MSPFSFFQREDPAEVARQFTVKPYAPTIELQGLVTGVDNVRYDVSLSAVFTDTARLHIARLITKAGSVEDLLPPDGSRGFRPNPGVPSQKPSPVSEFKRRLTYLQVGTLNRAKAEGNLSLDLLARIAIVKFLRTELVEQFNSTLERLRAKQKSLEGPSGPSGHSLRERCVAFQLAKRTILRRVGQQLFQTLRDVEKETLSRMRRSLFGAADQPGYELFMNRLLFTDNGRDDHLNAEHYVMFGNWETDTDRYPRMLDIARGFVMKLGLDKESGAGPDDLLASPENAQELAGNGVPDESTDRGKAQMVLLEAWADTLDREQVLDHIVAAYETVPLLSEYAPTINAQQLKNALVSKTERARVEGLLEKQGKLSPANLHACVRKVALLRGNEKTKYAGRFLRDFARYHRDLRRFDVLNSAMDTVSVISNEKLRNLSEINHTLYEFLLPEEEKPQEEKVVHHVILKSDIRDSTTLTRTLFERGLNPASYFSLNFFEPVNKLLPKYEATKVFIEGDAVILALFEREGEPGFGVARTCVLAREMISIVRAYNQQSEQDGLPTLDLGIGISYQDSSPMYLMDGNQRIMISKALNESDRLSSCNKGARKMLAGAGSLFNVYSFQTIDDADTGGNPDEFLMRYNIGGILMSEPAFAKLQQEISLEALDIELPVLWDKETVRLYTGIVPVAQGLFHRIVVREGRVARIEAMDFTLKHWTERRYYEVCTSDAIYEDVELRLKAKAAATAG